MTTRKTEETAPSDPSRLATIVSQLDGEDRVLVMRRGAGGGYSAIGTVEGGDVVGGPVELVEFIEDRWGGGRYQLRVQTRSPDGSVQFKTDGSATVQIEGEPKTGARAADDEPDGDRLDRIERALERLASAPAAPAFDMATLMPMMMQFGTQLAQTQMPLIEALTKRQGADARAMLEVFRDGMDMARSDSGSSDPFARVGELITTAIAQQRGGPVVQPQQLPAAPAEPEPADYPPHVLQIAEQLPALMNAARARVPATTVAARVFGASSVEQLRPLVDDAVLVDDLCAIHPPLERYRTWAGDLVAELAELVAEADDAAADASGGESPGESAA